MPIYAYKAKDGPEKTVEGELEALSREMAVAQIDSMGYSPVFVRERGARAGGGGRRFARGRASRRSVTVLTRQLASLTRSGVPILRALKTVGQQAESVALRDIVADIESTVRDGRMLSEALGSYPRLFPGLYVNMVRAGESGGVLDTVLFRLAETREQEEEFRRRVQAAMAYPLLVLLAGMATIFVLFSFFLPRVVVLFEDYRSLPLATRVLIGITDFFSEHWIWMLFVALLAGAIIRRLAILERGRSLFDKARLRIPFLGRLVRESEIARFARTLSLLIEVGIPIDRGLLLSANALRNTVFREDILRLRDETVGRGQSVSAGLRKSDVFPVFVSNMAAVGEEGGKLDESLNEVASYYEKNVEQQARIATSLIEPLLILGVGAVVGFIVIAMLLPIFDIGTALH